MKEKHLIFQLHCEESGFTRVSLFNEKYGIEIATSKMDAAPFLRDQVTESKIGKGLQYDKYDDEYIIEN